MLTSLLEIIGAVSLLPVSCSYILCTLLYTFGFPVKTSSRIRIGEIRAPHHALGFPISTGEAFFTFLLLFLTITICVLLESNISTMLIEKDKIDKW